MITFSGEAISKLDRGRCFMPASFRKEFPETDVVRLKIRAEKDEYLEIFDESDWKKRIDDYEQFLNSRPFLKFREMMLVKFTKEVESIEMIKHDDNAVNIGRILIPKKMLDAVGIKNEVLFIGTRGRIMLWNKEKYESYIQKMEEEMEAYEQSCIEKYSKE